MNQKDIETELDSAIGIQAINAFIHRIEDGEIEIDSLYRISIERKDKIGFHTAWILEKLCEKEADYALFFIDRLMNDFNKLKNKSSIRQYAKLLSLLLKKKSKNHLSQKLTEALNCNDSSPVIEVCFEQIINPTTQFSVKQNCCELLLHYKEEEIWIKEELEEFYQSLSYQNTPSAKSYRKKLAKNLNIK